jgi:hypothetical protein
MVAFTPWANTPAVMKQEATNKAIAAIVRFMTISFSEVPLCGSPGPRIFSLSESLFQRPVILHACGQTRPISTATTASLYLH